MGRGPMTTGLDRSEFFFFSGPQQGQTDCQFRRDLGLVCKGQFVPSTTEKDTNICNLVVPRAPFRTAGPQKSVPDSYTPLVDTDWAPDPV